MRCTEQGQLRRGASFDGLRMIGKKSKSKATAAAPGRPKQGQPPRGAESDAKRANVGALSLGPRKHHRRDVRGASLT